MDAAPSVPVIEELEYGATVRVGRQLFQRGKGGIWRAQKPKDNDSSPHWDSIKLQGPWTVSSHRKQFHPVLEADIGVSPAKPDEPGEDTDAPEDEDHSHKSSSDSDEEVKETTQSDSSVEFTNNKPEKIESDKSSDSQSSIAAAEEFCIDTLSESEPCGSSSDNSWISSVEEGDFQNEDSHEDDNTSDGTSKSTGSLGSDTIPTKVNGLDLPRNQKPRKMTLKSKILSIKATKSPTKRSKLQGDQTKRTMMPMTRVLFLVTMSQHLPQSVNVHTTV